MATEDQVFEDEVRRIARSLWPEAQLDGAEALMGREHDGIFYTEECIHIVEATTSRKKDKAAHDVAKISKSAHALRHRHHHKAVKGWFITKHEPTHDQRNVAAREPGLVAAISFAQFQAKLVDSRSYLSARDNYRFGSVRDPDTGESNPAIEYIDLDLVDTRTESLHSVDEVCNRILEGGRVMLLGDFGTGKSMTLREVYQRMRRLHFRNAIPQFPVYLNLRDHHGQTDTAEVLERHARAIGFAQPAHLVRAWRAGYAVLLLDGFDEIATAGWAARWRKLRDLRYRSMEAIRKFVRDTPPVVGLALAGRAHFFDGERERFDALGAVSFLELNLHSFTEEQVAKYLAKAGFAGDVPEWLPTRPLLLGTLVAKGILRDVLNEDGVDSDSMMDPSIGWHFLMHRIANREADIEAGIDGHTVRRLIERLATIARTYAGGLGPLTSDQIVHAFELICGYPPDDRGVVLLQRLPGLSFTQEEEGTRQFIDEEFADVARTGDVVQFVRDPYSFELGLFAASECVMDSLGVSVAARRLTEQGCSDETLVRALNKTRDIEENSVLASDVVRIALENGCDITGATYIQDVHIPHLELHWKMADLLGVEFQDCYFTYLDIDSRVNRDRLPRFRRCIFGEIDGPLSEAGLPQEVFLDGCVFDGFVQSSDTTKAILELDVPIGTRVLLTVLRKLFLQRGAGRRESALHRGLDHRARRLVPDVIRLLHTEDLISRSARGDETIWLPNRAASARVRRIVASPTTSRDSLIAESKNIS